MSLLPEIQIGLWNGWWFSAITIGTSLLIKTIYHKKTYKRLISSSTQTRKEKMLENIQTCLFFGILIYAIFVTIKIGTIWFWVGIPIFAIAISLYLLAMINFATTPFDQPAVKGLYSISRNPIYVMSFIAWIGVGIVTTSWIILIANIVMNILTYNTILAEERWCLKEYGKLYREYMKKVPRYLLFF